MRIQDGSRQTARAGPADVGRTSRRRWAQTRGRAFRRFPCAPAAAVQAPSCPCHLAHAPARVEPPKPACLPKDRGRVRRRVRPRRIPADPCTRSGAARRSLRRRPTSTAPQLRRGRVRRWSPHPRPGCCESVGGAPEQRGEPRRQRLRWLPLTSWRREAKAAVPASPSPSATWLMRAARDEHRQFGWPPFLPRSGSAVGLRQRAEGSETGR